MAPIRTLTLVTSTLHLHLHNYMSHAKCVSYKLRSLYNMFYNMCRNKKVRAWNPCDIFMQESSSSQYVVMVLNRPIALDFQQHLILNLWQKAVLRVTVDGGTDRWLSWLKLNNLEQSKNLDPDLITGDFDSVSPETLQYFMQKNKATSVIRTVDQNETDFTKALAEVHHHALSKNLNIDSVIVLVATSGRMDHILANVNTLFKARNILPDVNVFLLATDSLTWLLTEEVMHTISIPLSLRQNQEWCALLPIGSSCKATSTGLKWDLNNTLLEFGKLVSTSNTYNGDASVTIQSDNPLVWSMGISSLL